MAKRGAKRSQNEALVTARKTGLWQASAAQTERERAEGARIHAEARAERRRELKGDDRSSVTARGPAGVKVGLNDQNFTFGTLFIFPNFST